MPTPRGLPSHGDRVEYHPRGEERAYVGTVIERGTGSYWSLTIKFDVERTPRNLVDASWFWARGVLRFAQTEEVPT